MTQKLPQDEDENLQLEKVTLDKALEMIKTGKICDAKTIMAVYYWQTLTLRGDN